jgi:hypothetical protein
MWKRLIIIVGLGIIMAGCAGFPAQEGAWNPQICHSIPLGYGMSMVNCF